MNKGTSSRRSRQPTKGQYTVKLAPPSICTPVAGCPVVWVAWALPGVAHAPTVARPLHPSSPDAPSNRGACPNKPPLTLPALHRLHPRLDLLNFARSARLVRQSRRSLHHSACHPHLCPRVAHLARCPVLRSGCGVPPRADATAVTHLQQYLGASILFDRPYEAELLYMRAALPFR